METTITFDVAQMEIIHAALSDAVEFATARSALLTNSDTGQAWKAAWDHYAAVIDVFDAVDAAYRAVTGEN